MKLIVDAQLPSKLCELLNQLGLESIHVNELPKGDETSDWEIIKFTDRENLIVVTKDFDFYHSHMTLGKPKKLFIITTGNLKNRQLEELTGDAHHSDWYHRVFSHLSGLNGERSVPASVDLNGVIILLG